MRAIKVHVGAHWLLIVLVLAALSACASQPAASPASGDASAGDVMPELSPVVLGQGERLRAIATTSIVADVLERVAGPHASVQSLMPLGADPHAFEPTPRDVAAVADAHVVFINGAGLETFIEKLLEGAGAAVPIIPVSYGLDLLALEEHDEGDDYGNAAHDHLGVDPHTWFDPHNVMVWTENMAQALSALDPDHAADYQANAEAYRAELEALDAWIEAQVATVPETRRRLVTDHETFGYFCRRYGFEQVGTLFPGASTLAEPSAQDLARLEDAIAAYEVPAVFVGRTVNPQLAERVARDTGIQVVPLYTGSLSEPGGPAPDYLALMRYDVLVIVGALSR
jgi:ABC-type Zn uptake system ZnuABC Zn-binding protein ZnuA